MTDIRTELRKVILKRAEVRGAISQAEREMNALRERMESLGRAATILTGEMLMGQRLFFEDGADQNFDLTKAWEENRDNIREDETDDHRQRTARGLHEQPGQCEGDDEEAG